ncbi:uncharacterized protein LOC129854568 isoform X3 [Salvelinus fontinalis]|uniref:uncharacterized protein LOC129854568 isoform X3 n=1 Tax=Salvelinus fontinalis TaxID=8038 RepID=UPI0024854CA5|nr:uncharacterized protein LOC129854568 isoform X3 [Salvelinus fontinalis]
MKMDFRWCLSVGPVIIWFLSSLPSSQLKTVFLDILRCCVGESLSIEIPDDDQCPVSNFSVCTEKIGQVFEYSKKLSELTVDPRYQDRIQLKNDAYGLAVVIWNVTKEDEKQQYYVDCASTILKRFVIQIPRSIESSTTTAFPQPSTTTPGGSAGGSTTTAAPQPYQVYLWNILLGWYWYQYA